jgi:hypothetical protein
MIIQLRLPAMPGIKNFAVGNSFDLDGYLMNLMSYSRAEQQTIDRLTDSAHDFGPAPTKVQPKSTPRPDNQDSL